MTNESIYQEFERFLVELKSVSDKIVAKLKCMVLEAYSYHTEYDYSEHRPPTERFVLDPPIIITINSSLISKINMCLVNVCQLETEQAYKVDISVQTKERGIYCGKTINWFWIALQKEIDLKKYPRLIHPEFIDGRLVMK